jgi:hypothetical protein
LIRPYQERFVICLFGSLQSQMRIKLDLHISFLLVYYKLLLSTSTIQTLLLIVLLVQSAHCLRILKWDHSVLLTLNTLGTASADTLTTSSKVFYNLLQTLLLYIPWLYSQFFQFQSLSFLDSSIIRQLSML